MHLFVSLSCCLTFSCLATCLSHLLRQVAVSLLGQDEYLLKQTKRCMQKALLRGWSNFCVVLVLS